MKQLFLVACLVCTLAACNNETKNASNDEPKKEGDAKAADVQLPFTLAEPYKNWQMGSTENAVTAMQSLKAFVDRDFTGLAATLADSVEVRMDNFQSKKISRDSAIKLFTEMRGTYQDIKITMYDYESVIAADKSEEWVTIWYKQVWTDDEGKKDSLSVIDDFKMKAGKMAVLDEKIQRFQMKK